MMETTFISVHDLTPDARLLYASASITDILGYLPEEVAGRSAFEYFHPEEIPFARSRFGRGVELDKAAVLSYCRIRSKDNQWIGCECCFTIVHDVLVASTSIYRRNTKSHQRAVEAPIVRRLFASLPQDPRYHMLTHLSSKFTLGYQMQQREPRAAFFLNRFTRSSSIMYATPSIVDIFGLTADEVIGRSFYYCIQQNCLQDAIRCLESAKANDSIAYLRFWFRDPRQDLEPRDGTSSNDEEMTDVSMTDDDSDDDGGVQLGSYQRHDSMELGNNSDDSNFSSTYQRKDSNTIFDDPSSASSSNSSLGHSGSTTPPPNRELEIEAVVSCTSDGLVVVLRRAHALPPRTGLANVPIYTNGLFASPWAADPIIPPTRQFSLSPSPDITLERPLPPNPEMPVVARKNHTQDFMTSIRDVAAFAWSLTGINGSLADYSVGVPSGEAQPPNGLPVWSQDPTIKIESELDEEENRKQTNSAPQAHYPDHRHDNQQSPSRHAFASPTQSPADVPYHPPSHHSNFVTHYDPHFDGYIRPNSANGPVYSKNLGETECLYPNPSTNGYHLL